MSALYASHLEPSFVHHIAHILKLFLDALSTHIFDTKELPTGA